MIDEKHRDRYLFSMISGYNFYQITGRENNIVSAIHYNQDISVQIKIIKADKTSVDFWNKYISYPPNRKIFRWPIDIVNITETPLASLGNIGLVFRKQAFPKMEPLKKFVYNDNLLDWRNKEIQILILNFLDAIIELNSKSYSFIAFDVNRIFYDINTKEVLFDFFTSTIKKDKNVNDFSFLGNDIAIDFIAPWVQFDSIRFANSQMEQYSLAALLFRLMIGRMPYQGNLFSNRSLLMVEKSDYEEYHREMMEEYLAPPNVFIFDKNDDSNSIGLTLKEQEFVERWESLDEEIKSMFYNTFTHDSNKNGMSKALYSAQQWKTAIIKSYNS